MEEIDVTFTKEEREYIDKLLEEADEDERKDGYKLYTIEEAWGEILEQYHKDIQSWNR